MKLLRHNDPKILCNSYGPLVVGFFVPVNGILAVKVPTPSLPSPQRTQGLCSLKLFFTTVDDRYYEPPIKSFPFSLMNPNKIARCNELLIVVKIRNILY